MRRAAAAVSCLLVSWPAGAVDIATETRPNAVTVFPDRALVTRWGQLKLPAGAHTLVVNGLPGGLVSETLRVTGSGPAGLMIGSVESRVVTRQDLVHEQERVLQARLTELRDKRALTEAHSRALRLRQSFIESLAKSAAEGLTGDNADGQMRSEQWEQAWGRLQAGSEQALKELVAQDIAVRGIDDQIRKVEADLRAVKTGARTEAQVRIAIESPKDGPMEVAIQYQIGGASWSPVYDARLSTDTAKLSLASFGTVRQRTGEDWTEVALTLSTAQPAQGSQMPELLPWWIQPPPPPMPLGAAGSVAPSAMPAPAPKAERLYSRALRDAPTEAEEAAPAPVQMQVAEVASSEFAAEYRIPGKVAVPADSADHRFAIASRDMPVDLSARIVPKLDPKAYLHAEIKVAGEAPTLAGPVSLYRDGTYMGGARLASLKPGDTAELSFGVDDKVTVQYLPQRGQTGEQGFLSKEKRVERRFRTIVANLHTRPLTLKVYDQVPVSRDEAIKVALLDKDTTPGYARDIQDRPGVLVWNWEAKPGEKKGFDFGYVVTYPVDKVPTGF